MREKSNTEEKVYVFKLLVLSHIKPQKVLFTIIEENQLIGSLEEVENSDVWAFLKGTVHPKIKNMFFLFPVVLFVNPDCFAEQSGVPVVLFLAS